MINGLVMIMSKSAKIVLFISLLILSGCGSSDTSKRKDHERLQKHKKHSAQSKLHIGGTYSFGTNAKAGPIGTITIYPQSKTTALFYLDVCKGEPSYNLGQLFGQMIIKDNIGVFTSDKDDDLKCILKFEFRPGKLIVTTDETCDECGFGHAVYADNVYKQTDKRLPKYFIDGEGDTICFKGLTVEKYLHMFE